MIRASQLLENFQGDHLSAMMFGAVGDGVTDDTAAINSGIAFAAAKGRALLLPAQTYLVSNLATLTTYNTIIVGEPGARIKFTGTGAGISMDGTANLASGIRVILRDLILDGQGALDYGIDALLAVKCEFRNIRVTNVKTAGVRLKWGVSNLIDTLVVSANVEAFTSKPASGLILTWDGVNQSADNTVINPCIEGVSGVGIDLDHVQGTTIVGGTSEGNDTGLRIGASSFLTSVSGTDFEVNASFDLDISGHNSEFHSIVAISANSVKLRSGSYQTQIHNSYVTGTVVADAGAKYNGLRNNTFARVGGPSVADSDGTMTIENCFDIYNFLPMRNSDVTSIAQYPGTGNTPLPWQLLAKAIQSNGAVVADAGIKIVFTRLSDADYASALQFYTASDNSSLLRAWITPAGRFIIGSSGDDGSNALQVTGDYRINGNGQITGILGLGVSAVEKLDVMDGNTYVRSSYPGTGGTPTARKIFFETINNGGFRVAGCGIRGNFTRLGLDSDFSSALEFWTSNDNVPALAGWFSRAGRFIVGSASDDGTNILQATGNVAISGNLGLGVTAVEKLDVMDGNAYVRSSYPGTGATPTARKLFFETIQSGAFRVAGCGIRGVFTRISDTDYSSALEFWTAHDNTPLLRGWISADGRFILNSATDDGSNQLQVTGDSIITGNLTVTGTISGSGSGTVTHTVGALTSGQLIVGNGTGDIKTGNLSGDVSTSGGTSTTANLPVIKRNDSISLTGQTASVAATNLRVGGAVAPAGLYRVSYYSYTTTAGTGGTSTLTVAWNDGTAARTSGASVNLTLTSAAGTAFGSVTVRADGVNDIQVSTTVTGATGSPQYALYATLERIL